MIGFTLKQTFTDTEYFKSQALGEHTKQASSGQCIPTL